MSQRAGDIQADDGTARQPDAFAIDAAAFDDLAVGDDLKSKVAEAWRDFAGHLAAAIAALAVGTTLDVTLDPTASGTAEAVYSIQLYRDEEYGGQSAPADQDGESTPEVMATAVSNADLPQAYRLDRTAVANLVALGWAPPGVIAGSGEAFGARIPVGEANRLAVMVARTMRDVYGAPHPAFLTYLALGVDGDGTDAKFSLGAARCLAAQRGGGPATGDDGGAADGGTSLVALGAEVAELPLAEQVAIVVAKLLKTTPEALPMDPDGDINIRAGSAMVFVRVRENPPLVDVFSPVLTEVEPTQQLYVKLSELTSRMPIGRLYCTKRTVWASVPVFGRNLQPSHLMLAVQVMTGLADELDDRLHGEFGGRRFFGEGDLPEVTDDARTGMYL